MKNKISIIFGEYPVDNIDKNGEIDYLGNIESDNTHIQTFIDYCEDNFKSVNAFQNLKTTSMINHVAYALTRLSHIVILNTTKDPINHGYNAFILFPKTITSEQLNTFENEIISLNNYNISLLWDSEMDGFGTIDGRNKMTSDIKSVIKIARELNLSKTK